MTLVPSFVALACSDCWTPLAKLVEEGAEYVAVRTAIFDLHRRVETLLAEASR